MPGNDETLRQVCILAVPRTGSSYLTSLLRRCPELNVKGELFHQSWVGQLSDTELAALRSKSGGAIRDDATLCQWRGLHVRQTLDVLHEVGLGKPLVFKLFSVHLTRERVSGALFDRGGTLYIVLRRRPIESFISSLKAKKTGKHAGIDTTAIKPVLLVGPFLKWCARVGDWYTWVDDEMKARKLPHFELSYERHLKNASSTEALSTVLDGLRRAGLAVHWPAEIPVRERQDRELRYQDRVANWAEFEAALLANPAQAAVLQWAETAQ